jgi:hypothetical protein
MPGLQSFCSTEMKLPYCQVKAERARFWKAYAPLIALCALIMFGVWYALVGNSWEAWTASLVPIFGGAAHIYPQSNKARYEPR